MMTYEIYVSIKTAPDFNQEQIAFLKSCITLTRYPVSDMVIDYEVIEMLEQEMFRRGLTKKDYKSTSKPMF